MKRWHKVTLGAALVVFVIAASASTYVAVRWNRSYDQVEGPDLRASTDSAVIARGEYLVRGPAHCVTCHVGTMDEMLRADKGELLPLRGGIAFALGPLGVLRPPNLTPDQATGIGRYTDRQIARVLRHGVKPDGRALLWPMMPFFMMADDDVVAIISYLRSLEAMNNAVPASQYTALGKVIRSIAPTFEPRLGHTAPATAPPAAPTRERGEYIARYVANCVTCHTMHDPTTVRFTGPELAGGAEFPPMPGFPGAEEGLTFKSPNLTPHATGVLAKFGSKDRWIARFRQGRVYTGSPMPWGPFSQMSDADLEALWVYLNSLAPVENDVGQIAYRAGQ